jgi:hypothetical protein
MSCDPSHELWFSFFYVSNPKHFDEDLLLRLASFSSIFMYFVTCKTFFSSSLCLVFSHSICSFQGAGANRLRISTISKLIAGKK